MTAGDAAARPPMTPERWRRVEDVLDRALDLPPAGRAAFLAVECGSDDALRADVERLLAAADAPGLLTGLSAAQFAAPLVARTLGAPPAPPTPAADDAADAADARPTDARATHPERVGAYRIVREAGQGGMGTVYVAGRDDGHFRQRVALKLVRPGLHLDERFVRRFLEERRILARLEHPNVARLLDGGMTPDGLPYFVMEYVDGEPVDRWCDRRRLGVDARLELFCKVCRAVGYAHGRGVVHRDLKPSNILVTVDGEPKLLDFGIAKLLRDAALAHTQEHPAVSLTHTGQRLLTPEYASPEQVLGEDVTAASDVYALGVILYELLTGRRPYRTAPRTARAVERAILEEEPTRPSTAITRPPSGPDAVGAPSADAVSGARATTPERLRQRLRGDVDAIVLTALRKEPQRRYATADAFAADVRRHLEGRAVVARGEGAVYRLRKFVRRHRISVAAGAAGMLAGVALLAAADRSGARRWLGVGDAAASRLVPGATRRVTLSAALELDPVPSPDGRLIAYAADTGGAMRLYVRPAAGGRATPLTARLPGHHRAPRWSPDGTRIAFQSEGSLYVVPAAGGEARRLVAPAPGARWVAYPAWSPDGREIAYVQDWTIHVRAADGAGPPRRLPIANLPEEPHSLAWSPDGRWLAFVGGNSEFVFGLRPWGSTVNLGNAAPSDVWVVPAAGGTAVRVTRSGTLNTSPAWLPDSRGLLFVSNRDGDRDVYDVRLSEDGRPAGEPSRVTAGLGAHTVALTRDGRRAAYAVFRSAANVWSIAIPAPAPGGRPATGTGARAVTRGNQSVEGLSVSPDGRWLAFDTDRNGNQDVYVVPTEPGDTEPAPLASEPADEFMPHWSPDGREVAYYRFGADGRRAMMTVRVGGGAPRPVVASPRDQRSPHWSPDGRALAFSSDETGRDEVYVVARGADGRWGAARRLTSDGGYAARWSPDGRTIAYVRPDGIWTIPATGGARTHVHRIAPAEEPSLGFAEWAPDGRSLYFKWVDERGRASFWTVPAAGGRPRLLAELADPSHPSPRPEFATDGRRFYFTIAERTSDVWVMALVPAPR